MNIKQPELAWIEVAKNKALQRMVDLPDGELPDEVDEVMLFLYGHMIDKQETK